MNLLTAKELTKHYTDKELFTGADFSIEEIPASLKEEAE